MPSGITSVEPIPEEPKPKLDAEHNITEALSVGKSDDNKTPIRDKTSESKQTTIMERNLPPTESRHETALPEFSSPGVQEPDRPDPKDPRFKGYRWVGNGYVHDVHSFDPFSDTPEIEDSTPNTSDILSLSTPDGFATPETPVYDAKEISFSPPTLEFFSPIDGKQNHSRDQLLSPGSPSIHKTDVEISEIKEPTPEE